MITPDKAMDALASLGGTVLRTSLSVEAEQELQQALAADKQAADGGAQG